MALVAGASIVRKELGLREAEYLLAEKWFALTVTEQKDYRYCCSRPDMSGSPGSCYQDQEYGDLQSKRKSR